MRFCKPHWNELREAIKSRGMDHLVSDGGKEVVDRLMKETEDGPSAATFDPLMGSHNILLNTAMTFFGLSVMAPDGPDEGHHCPVCMLQNCKWIDWVANGARQEAERLKLVEDKPMEAV